MNYYVYRHTFANGKVYIGKGKGNRAYTTKNRSIYWKRCFDKYNIFCVELLRQNLTEKNALKIERYIIRNYLTNGFTLAGTLINITKGGEGVSGLKHTAYSKLKMSNARLGNTNRKNTKTTPKGIENIRNGQIGKKMSKESIEKTRQANLGKKRSKETIEKIRQANLGKIHSIETKKKLAFINTDQTLHTFFHKEQDLIITCTKQELIHTYNVSKNCVYSIASKRRKQAMGWTLLSDKAIYCNTK